jgi:MraZ protein
MDDDSSQPQKFFAGEFRHAIDEKNRITIPSRWRLGEPQEFIILPEPQHQFLLVMSHEEFLRMTEEAKAHSSVSAQERRVFLRHLHSRAEHGTSDRQGRLVLPVDMCKQLGLKGEVALVGGHGRFEIWNLQKWKRAHEEETATYQHVANVIGL